MNDDIPRSLATRPARLERVAGRAVFSIAVTALVGLAGYLAISWLAHLRP